MKQIATAATMRHINRSAILDLVREKEPISRSQLAHLLRLSLPTVMRIVEDLMEEDLVCLSGAREATRGRPRSLLNFNGSAYAVIGVDLGGTKMFGALADLSGNIQHEIYLPHENGSASHVERLCELIEQLLNAPRPPEQRIRGIGIGAPGLTRSPEGTVIWAPSLNWRDLPLQQILIERFDLPVFVENDVNLAALGEWGFGAGRGASNLVCIAVGTGIGAGVMISGSLYRGYHQGAGEVGYLLPGVQFLGRRYDQFGALESLASGTGIAERAHQLLAEEGRPEKAQGLTAEDVFNAARQGEAWATRIVAETADFLGLAVANIAALLDPEVVILGGGVSKSADLLIPLILQRLEGVIPFMPRLVASPLDRRAAVMGAIVLVLNGTTEYYVVKRVH